MNVTFFSDRQALSGLGPGQARSQQVAKSPLDTAPPGIDGDAISMGRCVGIAGHPDLPVPSTIDHLDPAQSPTA